MGSHNGLRRHTRQAGLILPWTRPGQLRSLAEYPKDTVAVLLAQFVYVGLTGFEHSQSEVLAVRQGRSRTDSPTCARRRSSPRTGDGTGRASGIRSGRAGGVRTPPAMPRGQRLTQVRQQPVTTDGRRATVDGFNRRISSNQRTNSSTSDRRTRNGSTSCSAHQRRNTCRSDPV